MTKERVYSPLFDEIEDCLRQFAQKDPSLSGNLWSKITREQHLSYLIEPPELDERLKKFYNETLSGLLMQVTGSRNVYQELVKQDLTKKVTEIERTKDATVSATIEVSRGVGWNLYKGSVWFGDLPNYKQSYDRLKYYSSELPSTFEEYFDWWKTTSLNDKVLVDYRGMLYQAFQDAITLRKDLAKKLGKKL